MTHIWPGFLGDTYLYQMELPRVTAPPILVLNRGSERDYEEVSQEPESSSPIEILHIVGCRWEHGKPSLLNKPNQVLGIFQHNGFEKKWDIELRSAEQFKGSEKLESSITKLRSGAKDFLKHPERYREEVDVDGEKIANGRLQQKA